MATYPLCIVTWNDIVTSNHWEEVEDAITGKTDPPMECKTIGWLLENNDEFCVISSCLSADLTQTNMTQKIPKGTVSDITVIPAYAMRKGEDADAR